MTEVMKNQLGKFAENMHEELTEMLIRLEEIQDSAVDMGFRAVEHKIEEAWGRLNSAAAAAQQYATGELEPR